MADMATWNARQHDVITRRTSKGGTAQERVRVGAAYLQGSTEHGGTWNGSDDALSDDAADARTAASVLLRGTRRNSVGALALDVERITDMVYGHLIEPAVPMLLGTDVTSWEQVIHGDQSDRSPVTVQRSYLSGPYRAEAWDRFAAPTAVYRANTRRTVSTARHSTRIKLPRGRDRAIDVGATCRAGTLRTVSPRYTAPSLVTPLVWSLVAPAADRSHRWQGHQLIERPAGQRQRRAAGAQRKRDRTIGVVEAPTTAAGWRELLDGLNRGDRVRVRSDIGDVTVTRSTQRYEARDKRNGRAHVYRLRNAERMADALA